MTTYFISDWGLRCTQCRLPINFEPAFGLRGIDPFLDEIFLCSPSCLVEYAWTLKEAQKKLSKSKRETPEA